MSVLTPEFEFVDGADDSIRYLEHGWPTDLCRWHNHEVMELHLIVDTHGKAFVGDYIGEFGPGALFLIGPHLPHNWVSDEFGHPNTIPLRDMLVQFNVKSIMSLRDVFPDFRELEGLLQRAAGGIEFLNFDKAQAVQSFAEIRDATGADRILKFLNFMLMVNRHPHQKKLSVANISEAKITENQSSVARTVDHIITNFAEDISLSSAAEMSHMSVTAFARNFQKLTGSRFTEFVTRVRISQACSLLQTTDEKIATICHEVGFKNLANFNRHFLRIKNTTPSAYRDFTRSELSN
ncbi:MAG: helix-turn-helix domain-containing protein [Candidatus Puniceispirillaceae bacterium]